MSRWSVIIIGISASFTLRWSGKHSRRADWNWKNNDQALKDCRPIKINQLPNSWPSPSSIRPIKWWFKQIVKAYCNFDTQIQRRCLCWCSFKISQVVPSHIKSLPQRSYSLKQPIKIRLELNRSRYYNIRIINSKNHYWNRSEILKDYLGNIKIIRQQNITYLKHIYLKVNRKSSIQHFATT